MTKEDRQMYNDQLKIIQDFLSEDVDDHNADFMVERLTKMNSYLVLVSELYPSLIEIQQQELQMVYDKNLEWVLKSPATVVNRFMECQTTDINKLVNWCERINRAIVHISENMRTQISYAKQQMILNRSGY